MTWEAPIRAANVVSHLWSSVKIALAVAVGLYAMSRSTPAAAVRQHSRGDIALPGLTERFAAYWYGDRDISATIEMSNESDDRRTVTVTVLVNGTEPIVLPTTGLAPHQ